MNYKIIEKKEIFNRFFKIDEVHLNYDRFTGGQLENICRFAMLRPEAVAVILENESTGKIILVEQFRYSSIKLSKMNGWTQEVIAGLRDEGEEPEESAKRETLEETGYQIHNLEFVQSFHPSVGISDEIIHLFHGSVTNDDRIEEGGGLEHENEDIRVIEKSLTELLEDIHSGNIIDGKTIMAIQWLALKKLQK